MEDKEQVLDCFEEQLKSILEQTSDNGIIIAHDREIWEIILKAIQDNKRALLTKSEREQALKIIVKKDVDVEYIKALISDNQPYTKYNSQQYYSKRMLTETEFNLVAKVVKEMVENESK